MSDVIFEQVKQLAAGLTPTEKERLVEWLQTSLNTVTMGTESPRQLFRGLWADLGAAPSADEIDQTRREMWGS
jgi:hypothetical protein